MAQQGRTSITIAHRLSTIMESDRSAFMNGDGNDDGDGDVDGGVEEDGDAMVETGHRFSAKLDSDIFNKYWDACIRQQIFCH